VVNRGGQHIAQAQAACTRRWDQVSRYCDRDTHLERVHPSAARAEMRPQTALKRWTLTVDQEQCVR
jgi:hypothetical protein